MGKSKPAGQTDWLSVIAVEREKGRAVPSHWYGLSVQRIKIERKSAQREIQRNKNRNGKKITYESMKGERELPTDLAEIN